MSENNKQRLLKVLQMIQATDENKRLTVKQLVDDLYNKYDIKVDRKAVTADLEELRDAGFPLVHKEHSRTGWYWNNSFEEYELKFLLDAVSVSRSLSIAESRKLIEKINNLANQSGRDMRAVTLPLDANFKSTDDKNSIKLKAILRAIKENCKISFEYYKYVDDNKKKLSHKFLASPYYLVPSNDEYFLICDLGIFGRTSHFRLDMMDKVKVMDSIKRKPLREGFIVNGQPTDLSKYMRESLNMWVGNVIDVRLKCDNSLRNCINSKFGNHVMKIYQKDHTFVVNVKIPDTEGFYKWLASLGQKAVLLGPDDCVKQYKEFLHNMIKIYEN